MSGYNELSPLIANDTEYFDPFRDDEPKSCWQRFLDKIHEACWCCFE